MKTAEKSRMTPNGTTSGITSGGGRKTPLKTTTTVISVKDIDKKMFHLMRKFGK